MIFHDRRPQSAWGEGLVVVREVGGGSDVSSMDKHFELDHKHILKSWAINYRRKKLTYLLIKILKMFPQKNK